MKKNVLWIFLLVLAILMTFSAAADTVACSSGTIIQRTQTGDKILGLAVSITSGQSLITSQGALCDPSEMVIRTQNGEYAVSSIWTIGENTGLAMILMDEEVCTPMTVTAQPASSCMGVQPDGSIVTTIPTEISQTRIGDYQACTFSLQKSFLPGALLLDANDDLAGIMIADYGEGIHRKAAFTGYGLYELFESGITMNRWTSTKQQNDAVSEADSFAAPETNAASAPADAIVCTFADGLLTIDWSTWDDAEYAHTVYVSCLLNPYYSVYSVEANQTSQTVLAAPGQILTIQVNRAENGTDFNSNGEFAIFNVPEAERFTDYNYLDTSIYLTVADAAKVFADTEQIPEVPMTAELLTDESCAIYLQVTSTYMVTQNSDCLMTAVLTAPDGTWYLDYSGFIFSPDYMNEDIWHWNLTELFHDCARYENQQLPAGEYSLSYYLDGKLANTFQFTLGQE